MRSRHDGAPRELAESTSGRAPTDVSHFAAAFQSLPPAPFGREAATAFLAMAILYTEASLSSLASSPSPPTTLPMYGTLALAAFGRVWTGRLPGSPPGELPSIAAIPALAAAFLADALAESELDCVVAAAGGEAGGEATGEGEVVATAGAAEATWSYVTLDAGSATSAT